MYICCSSSLASLAVSGSQQKIIIVILKWLKVVSLAPPLWILYRILKKCKSICLCKIINLLKMLLRTYIYIFISSHVLNVLFLFPLQVN